MSLEKCYSFVFFVFALWFSLEGVSPFAKQLGDPLSRDSRSNFVRYPL